MTPIERRRQIQARWNRKPSSRELKSKLYKQWVNSPAGKIRRRELNLKHRQTINGKIANRVRARMWMALRKGFTKSYSTIELLGCSIHDFRLHLERQFGEGMSWDNVGEWEIDHITPLSVFDLSSHIQQKLAFRFTNCRPVWKEINQRKSNKIIDFKAA